MVTVEKFIEGVNSIYIEQPDYQLGHDGSDGKCDCIGMVRGALIRAGETGVKNMGGTNQAARKAIKNLQKIKKESQLRKGDVVLKTRDKNDKDMPLPDQYREGESGYDPNVGETNYTHIGVVTQANPLRITHMTSPTAKIDQKLGNWTQFGQLPWVKDEGEPVEGTAVATVYAESGKTVKMRSKPSSLCRLYWDVPVGSEVVMVNQGDTWSQISWQGRTGYMMTKYLVVGDRYVLVIPGLDKDQVRELQEIFPGSYVEIERG